MGTPPSGQQHLAQEVDRQLQALRDAPLSAHPRVYEQLDAAIRQELETEAATGGDPAPRTDNPQTETSPTQTATGTGAGAEPPA